MTSFRTIWRQWHIPGAHNWRVFDVDPGDYHMLDGVEDWIRHSMSLRGLSERRLREMKQEAKWSNDVLVEHLSGELDGSHTTDEDLFDRLAYQNMEGEAHKYIPSQWLNKRLAMQGQRDPSGSWRVRVHYSTDRFLVAESDSPLTAQAVVPAPIPLSSVTLDRWDDVTPSWPYSYQTWNHWQRRGTPPEPKGDKPIESEEYGEWGGYLFTGRGSMFVWIVAESVQQIEGDPGLVENALPSAFDPDDFEGPASLSERM
jgi:hypothetical protein